MACSSNLHLLADAARFVDETLNLIPRKSQPYVGASAFAHKGGLHVSALAKNAKAYEHVDPARVGNEQRVLVSELSASQCGNRAVACGASPSTHRLVEAPAEARTRRWRRERTSMASRWLRLNAIDATVVT